jgi:hypothetical protein
MARSSIGSLVFVAVLVFGAAMVFDFGGLRTRLFADESERAAPPPSAKLPPAAEPQKPSAPITPAWYLGTSGFEGGELERQSARATMLVYFQRKKCDPCRKFEREVLGAAEVKAFLAEVVKVRIDLDDGEPAQKLATRFGVAGAPAVAVVPQRGPPRLIPDRALGSAHTLIAFSR